MAFSDGTTQEISVELGITDGILVEILEGLNEGDEILVSSPN
jgi:multidrug efflux pump subunit AcrA (membrane-fusion protein)